MTSVLTRVDGELTRAGFMSLSDCAPLIVEMICRATGARHKLICSKLELQPLYPCPSTQSEFAQKLANLLKKHEKCDIKFNPTTVTVARLESPHSCTFLHRATYRTPFRMPRNKDEAIKFLQNQEAVMDLTAHSFTDDFFLEICALSGKSSTELEALDKYYGIGYAEAGYFENWDPKKILKSVIPSVKSHAAATNTPITDQKNIETEVMEVPELVASPLKWSDGPDLIDLTTLDPILHSLLVYF
jgi:hypothetical protein